jgi:hypothetical protein
MDHRPELAIPTLICGLWSVVSLFGLIPRLSINRSGEREEHPLELVHFLEKVRNLAAGRGKSRESAALAS